MLLEIVGDFCWLSLTDISCKFGVLPLSCAAEFSLSGSTPLGIVEGGIVGIFALVLTILLPSWGSLGSMGCGSRFLTLSGVSGTDLCCCICGS